MKCRATRPKTRCECKHKRNNADAKGHRATLSQTLHAPIQWVCQKATFTHWPPNVEAFEQRKAMRG